VGTGWKISGERKIWCQEIRRGGIILKPRDAQCKWRSITADFLLALVFQLIFITHCLPPICIYTVALRMMKSPHHARNKPGRQFIPIKLNPSTRKTLTTANPTDLPSAKSYTQHTSSNAKVTDTSATDHDWSMPNQCEVSTASKPSLGAEEGNQLSMTTATARPAKNTEVAQDPASSCTTTLYRVNTSSMTSEGTRKSPTSSLRRFAGGQDRVGLNDDSASQQLDHVWPALTPDVKGVNVSRSRQSSMTISLHPQNLDTTQAGSADALDVKQPGQIPSA
jgi:hypothetical protein